MTDKEKLEKALFLLEEADYFLCMVPNKKYKTRTTKDSYELESMIRKFLKENNNAS